MAQFLNTINEYKADVVIVGAGISGLTLAEKYAHNGKKVLVIEKRNHIGGNCYDYYDSDGILVSLYGPHYFHTNDDGVWEYIQKFSTWKPYEHRVIAHVGNKKVPIPVNRKTLNTIFDINLTSEQEVQAWYEANREPISDPQNAEDAVKARMGSELYKLLFEGYTKKQWGISPALLSPEVTNRIPIRLNNDDRYFTDTYQALPVNGYTAFFEKMIESDNISIILNTDWDEVKNKITWTEKLFFTGRIDQFFDERYGKLQYRSLRFEFETLDQEYFQEYAQENYPSLDIPFTRIVEYKHATGQKNPKTVISREYSTWDGEPYYPVPSIDNRTIYTKYQDASVKLEGDNIFFVGRLANYKYFNMDQAFRNALDLFNRLENNRSYE
ncbi:MAG: UDP-galactopyranose mutase [Candidatus Paceibacterota bacterium]